MGRNWIINGCMRIWQRGAGPSAATHTADRWRMGNGTGGTVHHSRQSINDTQAPYLEGFRYCLQAAVSVSSSAAFNAIAQRIEDVRNLAGKTVTVSYWAQVAAGSTTIFPNFTQVFGTGGSTGVTINGATHQVTTSWQRFSQQITLPAVTGKTIGTAGDDFLQLGFAVAAGATPTLQITGIQVECCPLTDFDWRPLAQEVALCQRYYEKSYDLEVAPGTADAAGAVLGHRANGGSTLGVMFKTRKRIKTGTMTYYSPVTGANGVVRNYNATADQGTLSNYGTGETGVSGINTGSASLHDLIGCHWTCDAEL